MWKGIITCKNNHHQNQHRVHTASYFHPLHNSPPDMTKYFPPPVHNSDITDWHSSKLSVHHTSTVHAFSIPRWNLCSPFLLKAKYLGARPLMKSNDTTPADHLAVWRRGGGGGGGAAPCHLMKARHTTLPPLPSTSHTPTPLLPKATSSPLQPLSLPPLWYTCVKAKWQIAHIN